MKENIHPQYEKTTITCACGEVIETSSTKKNIRVGDDPLTYRFKLLAQLKEEGLV